MIRQQGCSYKNTGVELDNQEFIDCRFDDCRIVYRGGPPPRFGGKNQFIGCQIVFEDAAASTMEVLKLLARHGNAELVQGIFRDLVGTTN